MVNIKTKKKKKNRHWTKGLSESLNKVSHKCSFFFKHCRVAFNKGGPQGQSRNESNTSAQKCQSESFRLMFPAKCTCAMKWDSSVIFKFLKVEVKVEEQRNIIVLWNNRKEILEKSF